VVYEEVGVNKQQVVQNQQVSETVRREELRMDKQGSVDVAGGAVGTVGSASAGAWDQAMPTYRQKWQQRFGATGGRWEDYEPGYRYGYELRSRPEYRGRQWSEVEPQFERDWTTRNPASPWSRVRDSVRDTWEDARS